MTRTGRPNVLVLLAILTSSFAVRVDAFRQHENLPLDTTICSLLALEGDRISLMNRVRGGSLAIDVDIESSDEEETEDEEEAPSLTKATKKAATKAVKESVAVAMKSTQKKSRISTLGNFFKLPYIVKACLNPVVFLKMTSGYWKSLYNINYMNEKVTDPSQDLRSALEQKARYGGGGKKPSRGKRKMKPGQAKTLSDLPQLNT